MVNDTPARLDDDIDVGIVRAVLQDARATLAELSAAVGLSVSAVQARLRRLEARGVITGYRALVDAEAVGKPLAAFVEITPLDPGQPDNAPELLEHLAEIEARGSVVHHGPTLSAEGTHHRNDSGQTDDSQELLP